MKMTSKQTKSKSGFKSLGRKDNRYRGLEIFPNPIQVTSVTLTSDEVTALCPVTSQPDWYQVVVVYKPAKSCIESKSFKLFLHSLRNTGMFCEDLADYILTEIQKAISAERVEVTIIQKPRGGVSITAIATYERDYT